jgi:hypothetical protein
LQQNVNFFTNIICVSRACLWRFPCAAATLSVCLCRFPCAAATLSVRVSLAFPLYCCHAVGGCLCRFPCAAATLSVRVYCDFAELLRHCQCLSVAFSQCCCDAVGPCVCGVSPELLRHCRCVPAGFPLCCCNALSVCICGVFAVLLPCCRCVCLAFPLCCCHAVGVCLWRFLCAAAMLPVRQWRFSVSVPFPMCVLLRCCWRVSHGYLYEALSRVNFYSNICVVTLITLSTHK